MLKTAYVTNYSDDDEWQVERVPYNIPGAVLYYCNERYKKHYSKLQPYLSSPPSVGPKSTLLVVDMNYGPMRLGDTGSVLDARRASYDAALTLQPTQALHDQPGRHGGVHSDRPMGVSIHTCGHSVR